MRPLAAVILLLTVLGATRGEGARPSTSTCRELCADEILACMQSGRRPQACRRHLVRRCRRTRGELCGDTVQTWVTSGPIRWEVEAPATVAPDQHFALVLDVGAATTRVEGRVRACHGVSADGACDPSVDPFVYDPPSFAGLPGRIAIDTHVDQAFDGPLDWSLHAELYLYDQDGVRHGPFVSPLMHTTIDLTNELRIRAAEQNTGKGSVTLAALAGTQASTEIFFWIGGNSVAGGGSFVVTATSDAAWLHAAPADPVSFHVAADSTGLEPRPIPYTGHLTFAAPGIPAPSVVDVALYVLPMIDVQWVTPPPAVIDPESTFPLALQIDGPGIDAVELSLTGPITTRPIVPGSPDGPPGVFELGGERGAVCTALPVDDVVTGTYRVRLHDGPSFFLPTSPHPPLEVPPVPVQLGPMTTPRVTVSPPTIAAEAVVGEPVDDAAFQVVQNCGTPQTWTATANVPWISLPSTSGVAVVDLCCHSRLEPVTFNARSLRPAEMPYQGLVTVSAPGMVGGSTSIAVSLRVHAAPPYTIEPDAVVLAAVAGQSPLSTVIRGDSPGRVAPGRVAWKATADVTWILLPVLAGANIDGTFPIGIDATGLAPDPHAGTVTFHTPHGEPRKTTVPVHVDVFPAS